jgi:hypothetical protein
MRTIRRYWQGGLFILLVLSGCTRTWNALFISMSQHPLQLSVVPLGTQSPFRQLVLGPGESHQSDIMLGTLVVMDASGTVLLERPITLSDASEANHPPGKRTVHFLVTEQGVYPVPFRYWNTWGQHLNEIIGGSLAPNSISPEVDGSGALETPVQAR